MRDVVSEVGSFYTGLAAPPSMSGQGSQVSPWVDLQGFDGACIQILCSTYTSGSMTPVVEESDNASTANTVANADLVAWSATSPTDHTPVKVGNAQPTAITTAPTAINWRIGYLGGKRYIRLNSTSSSAVLLYDAIILLGRPRFAPSSV